MSHQEQINSAHSDSEFGRHKSQKNFADTTHRFREKYERKCITTDPVYEKLLYSKNEYRYSHGDSILLPPQSPDTNLLICRDPFTSKIDLLPRLHGSCTSVERHARTRKQSTIPRYVQEWLYMRGGHFEHITN